MSKKTKSEILTLVADLYSLGSDNKSFIHSRYSLEGGSLEPYKSIISESLYPNVSNFKGINLSVGRKAISDYFKATKDKSGPLELMVHYLESGNRLTIDYGDIDQQFYFSLESMFDRILSVLLKQSDDVQKRYLLRMESVVAANDIGWGYYDYIRSELNKSKKKIFLSRNL